MRECACTHADVLLCVEIITVPCNYDDLGHDRIPQVVTRRVVDAGVLHMRPNNGAARSAMQERLLLVLMGVTGNTDLCPGPRSDEKVDGHEHRRVSQILWPYRA